MAGTGAGVLPVQTNGQFMGGAAMPAAAMANYYTPQPLSQGDTAIQGTGKWVSPGAQFVSGLTAGANLMGNLQQSRRGTEMYNAAHRANMAAMAFQGATPAQIGAENQAFTSMPGTRALAGVGHMVAGLPGMVSRGVSDVAGLFEGGGVIPASTQGQMPPQFAPGAGSRAFAGGGVAAPNAVPAGVPPPGGAPAPASVPMPPPGAPAPTPGPQPTGAPGGPPQAALAPAVQQGIQASQNPGIMAAFEGWATHLFHGGALQGVGKPGALPQNPNAPQSGSLATSGQAHSLTPEWFDQGDQLAMQAALAAGDAGQDPMQVFNALQNQRTSFLQSHFVRDLSTANAALATGDQKGAEAAIKSAYYYVPNGQDIQFSKGKDGSTQFEDPLTGKMTSLDPTTVGMIGQAALNPEQFGSYINQIRILTQEAQAKVYTGLGQYYRGKGIWRSGTGAELRALADQNRVPYQNLLDKANATRALMQGEATHMLLRAVAGQDPAIQRNVEVGTRAAQNILLGPEQATAPDSLAGGKVIHSGKTPPWLSSLSADDQNQFMAYAAGFAAKGIPGQQAAQLASDIYRYQSQTHPAQGDSSPYAMQFEKTNPGKAIPDVLVDPKAGVVHFWNGKGWSATPYNPAGQAVFGPAGPYMQMLTQLASSSMGAPAAPAPAAPESTVGLDASYGSGSAP